MSYTICSRFKGEHIVYAGYTICTSREHIVYGAFCGSTELASCFIRSFLNNNTVNHFTYVVGVGCKWLGLLFSSGLKFDLSTL